MFRTIPTSHSLLLFCVLAQSSYTSGSAVQYLFNGEDLTGWQQHGGSAKYTVEDGMIVGTAVPDTPNSFLCTDRHYANFVLELELKIDGELNSGIQIRSHVAKSPTVFQTNNADGTVREKTIPVGRVHGYQVEVDPSERAWSGGIYDEGRRGWLYTLQGDEHQAAREAFLLGQWNTFRIVAVGHSIRTWVNGVPVANLVDDMSTAGFIALQVHGIGKHPEPVGKQIRWRNLQIRELTVPGKNLDSENLVAWCIVPFDAKKRGPAERASMLKRLGMTYVAYDWRAEHVPTFEDEILQYKKHDLNFFAFWDWHDDFAPLIAKHQIKPQIWYMIPATNGTQEERVKSAASQLVPLVDKTHKMGLKLGLYNHGGWQGEPANLVAVCEHLRKHRGATHVGIVYNFHHGHGHIHDFAEQLRLMQPYLFCLNLNGMANPETVKGGTNKILPIGSGLHEQEMIQIIAQSGYTGPLGILDHRSDTDAEESLQANLNGLQSLIDRFPEAKID